MNPVGQERLPPRHRSLPTEASHSILLPPGTQTNSYLSRRGSPLTSNEMDRDPLPVQKGRFGIVTN